MTTSRFRSLVTTILRRASYMLGAVLLAVGVLAIYVEVDGIPKYPHETPILDVTRTPARFERGKKLVQLICIDCHMNNETHQLTGQHLAHTAPEFADVYSKNITNDPEMGIGKWTDGELIYFLRTGVRPDGQYVPPWMIKMPHLSDEDMASVVTFLRSSDPLVAPAKVPSGTTKPKFLAKALAHGVFGPLPYPTAPIPMPPRSDRVAYGRYLTTVLECWTCHSADFKTLNVMEPEKTPGFLGGGNPLKDAEDKTIYSANLTSDDETGIGRWSEAELVRALTKGVRPDGRVLRAPMMPHSDLDDDEAGSIYAYLRTVPRIRNAVPRPAGIGDVTASAGHATGKALYERYGCASCHGANGVGTVGDLRGANERYPSDEALRAWIEDAPKMKPGTRMPPWKGIIRDEDYAPLMSYVRTLARPGKSALK